MFLQKKFSFGKMLRSYKQKLPQNKRNKSHHLSLLTPPFHTAFKYPLRRAEKERD